MEWGLLHTRCLLCPPSPPHPSSSPHQDTLVLVNSGFKRNAAFLWFSAGPVLNAGTCVSVALWSGRGSLQRPVILTHLSNLTHSCFLPWHHPWHPPCTPLSPWGLVRNEKFLPLQVTILFTSSRLFHAITSSKHQFFFYCWTTDVAFAVDFLNILR